MFEDSVQHFDKSYKIDEFVKASCRQYANSKYVGHYVNYRAVNEECARRHAYFGKIGQVYAHYFLTDLGLEPSDLNLEVYGNKPKTWDTYLNCGDKRVHVKTCDQRSARKHGESWVFQASDFTGKGRDEIYDTGDGNDFFLFLVFDEANNTLTIRSLVSWNYIQENGLLKSPALNRYGNIKQAVYYADLPQPTVTYDFN